MSSGSIDVWNPFTKDPGAVNCPRNVELGWMEGSHSPECRELEDAACSYPVDRTPRSLEMKGRRHMEKSSRRKAVAVK